MGSEVRHTSFSILIIGFLLYTIVEKVIEPFLYFRSLITLKIGNNIIIWNIKIYISFFLKYNCLSDELYGNPINGCPI